MRERTVEVVCRECGGTGEMIYYRLRRNADDGSEGGVLRGSGESSEDLRGLFDKTEPQTCYYCKGAKTLPFTLLGGSLAALKLELAEAVDQYATYDAALTANPLDKKAQWNWQQSRLTQEDALAAVRNHPEYRAADAAKGEKDGE